MKTDELLAAECRLKQIEQDFSSFTPGRRNDDMVNWFLAKKIVEVLTPGALNKRPVREYLMEFEAIPKTKEQCDSLFRWNFDGMDTEKKIRLLWQHYGALTSAAAIRDLEISVSYRPAK
jgi:hypothetical protein